MGSETMTDSWFSNLWRSSVGEPEKATIGVLAFEVVTMMSKVVNLWKCLSERQITKLREEISSSVGIQRFISDDENYLMDLVLAEIIENLGSVAKSVAVIGKRCADPAYHHLEKIIYNPDEVEQNWTGWEYKLKKMDRRVKKMERFVSVTLQLYQELEVLAELEQSLRRMQAGADVGQVKLLEFQHKVIWQRQEVKNLREMSPWVRTYDYVVRMLLRSVFTIIQKIKHVFCTSQLVGTGGSYKSGEINSRCLVRSQSISAHIHSSVYPAETGVSRVSSASFERSFSNLGLSCQKNGMNNKQLHARSSSMFSTKQLRAKSKRFAQSGPFRGCMPGGSDSPILESCVASTANSVGLKYMAAGYDKEKDANAVRLPACSSASTRVHFFKPRSRLLNAPPTTLGYAGLALHYANIIILIEKLAPAPHLISLDARDDLFGMLPSSIRTILRAKLKVFSKSLAASVYDAALATEWSLALGRMLDWLSPLAHNMIRWHSERNFEKQRTMCGANAHLVQTLFFANQAKIEAAITELLMGLNYLARFGRELNEKPLAESLCGKACDDYISYKGLTAW